MLTIKRCLTDFGRDGCSEDMLRTEAAFILLKLQECKSEFLQPTKDTWNAFISFRDNDETNQRSQDQELSIALEVAHMRANATRLQRFERQLQVAIAATERSLGKCLVKTFEFSKMAFSPYLHPINACKNIWFAMCHPMVTLRAVVKWVKENPWKAGLVILGSIAVGVAVGFGIGGPLIAGAFLLDFTVGIVAGVVTTVVAGSIPMLAAAGEGGLLVKSAQKQQENDKKAYADRRVGVCEEVTPLQQALKRELEEQRDTEYIRTCEKEATIRAKNDLLLLKRLEEDTIRQQQEQLYNMDRESLQKALGELQEAHAVTRMENQRVSNERAEVEQQLAAVREDHAKMNIAEVAALSQWNTIASMATAREDHTAILLNSSKVLVTGGKGLSSALASCEIYDPSTGQWNTIASMATARDYHTATLLNSGKVLITGGYNPSSGSLASCEIYDPSTGQWNTTTRMITGREQHTATLLNSGKVLVTGGWNSSSIYLPNSEIYDPSMGQWNTTANMATARTSHTITLLNPGKVLVTGGHGSSGSLASCEIYDASAGKWNTTTLMARAHEYHTATLLNSHKVLLSGGSALSTPLASS
ncbi:unnamed protein product [Didymodactylos carnosus]|uniref:Attractin/MKLN-like beta-propeller domain-containing protein n=1 Tax=Didymodactylos carnosus TaxID=1234261 RepID=A0A8S2JQB5_9BILA|nr:unnamed protein product [Didymodactylos carnosus]CAF3808713.1 unnamed protein product [Didymodactylos carnosus]